MVGTDEGFWLADLHEALSQSARIDQRQTQKKQEAVGSPNSSRVEESHKQLKERQDQANYANENLIKELLSTVDNLERALEHGRKDREGDEDREFLEGVELTHRSMLQALERFGVTVIEAEGKPFDPQFHEAIRQVPSDTHEPGTVVEVFQRGYQLKDRLLRPALVAVAAAG